MKYISVLFFALLLNSSHAQSISAYSADALMARASAKDTLYIINFWATWCAPCVHELPEFNALQRRYADKPVKIILVSLDFKENYPYKLELFAQRQRLLPQVAWLSDTDPNIFIPKIDNSWEGSIPATLIVQPGRHFKKFIEGATTEKEISAAVNRALGM